MRKRKLRLVIFFMLMANGLGFAQERRKVIIDQDCSGPGGSNMQTLLTLIQSPQVEVLGITVVSGNQWRDEEVARTLRLLELIGRSDVPVVPGAVFPLVHRRKEAQLWQARYGKVAFAGAWDDRWWHEHDVIPPLLEGEPHTRAVDEDAAHFLIHMVHKYPHEVTIYEGGPMTDLALANAIDPHFAELAEELVFMGGSLSPQTEDPEFLSAPRHEFNFWFDPEAAKSVLEAPWRKIVCTPVDISVKTKITDTMVAEIKKSQSAAAEYVVKYYMKDQGGFYMWDELAAAAWIDPTLITKKEMQYMSVDLDHGAAYGNTLTWTDKDNPRLGARLVEIQMDLDLARFNKMFVDLMKASTPGGTPAKLTDRDATHPSISPDATSIAFTHSEQSPNATIISSSGSQPARTVALPVTANCCMWSSDGRSLEYLDVLEGVPNFWSVPISGGPAKQVTHFTSQEPILDFALSRNGATLAILRSTENSDAVWFSDLK